MDYDEIEYKGIVYRKGDIWREEGRPVRSWRFNRISDKTTHLTVDESPYFIDLVDAETGRPGNPSFAIRFVHGRGWTLAKRIEMCPRCESNLILEHDYLCAECRYGIS